MVGDAESRWTMTRRDVLASLLGVPLAFEACRKRRHRPSPARSRSVHARWTRLRDAPLDASGAEQVRVRAHRGAGASGYRRLGGRRLGEIGSRCSISSHARAVLHLRRRRGRAVHMGRALRSRAETRQSRAAFLLARSEPWRGRGGRRAAIRREQLVRALKERLFYGGRGTTGLPARGGQREDWPSCAFFLARIDGGSRARGKGRRAFDLPLDKSPPMPTGRRSIASRWREWLEQQSSRAASFVVGRLRVSRRLWIVDDTNERVGGPFYFASRVAMRGTSRRASRLAPRQRPDHRTSRRRSRRAPADERTGDGHRTR